MHLTHGKTLSATPLSPGKFCLGDELTKACDLILCYLINENLATVDRFEALDSEAITALLVMAHQPVAMTQSPVYFYFFQFFFSLVHPSIYFYFYFILFYFILFYFILFYFILFYFILFYF